MRSAARRTPRRRTSDLAAKLMHQVEYFGIEDVKTGAMQFGCGDIMANGEFSQAKEFIALEARGVFRWWHGPLLRGRWLDSSFSWQRRSGGEVQVGFLSPLFLVVPGGFGGDGSADVGPSEATGRHTTPRQEGWGKNRHLQRRCRERKTKTQKSTDK